MTQKRGKDRPSPEELLAEVRDRPEHKTYEFQDYIEAIIELQAKGYSYARIAAFLTERLKIAVTRGQVYRAVMIWKEEQEEIERQRAEDAAYEAKYGSEEFDSREDYEAHLANQTMQAAAADLLRYAMEKYPQEKLPEPLVEVFRRNVFFLDDKARDERDAEFEDQRMEAKNGGGDAPTE